jgi:hypothetical protein
VGSVRGAPLAFAVAYLALRGAMLFQPGYQDDLKAYRRWALGAAEHGLAHVYTASDMDYPPLYAYALWPLGRAYLALSPGAGTPKGGDPALWTALVKLPPLVFDLATAALLFRLGRRADADAERAARLPWRFLLPGAYLANPAVVFDTGYWGHPDSVHSFFVLGALLLAADGRAAGACVALALGALMKPLAAPFLPLLACLVWCRSGYAGLLRGAAAALATASVVFLPFVLAGEAGAVLRRVLLDLDAMPYTSVNAHNLWGLFGGWRPADAPLLGPLSATTIGLVLFGAALLGLLLLLLGLERGGGVSPQQACVLGAAVSFSFFMLSTHMHENHLFVALPLLAAALPLGREWRRMFAFVTLAVLLNLALHDPELPGRWPFTLGGATGVPRLSHGRVFFAGELLAVRAANAFSVGVFLAFSWSVLRLGREQGAGLR